jgi:hypothetical protein
LHRTACPPGRRTRCPPHHIETRRRRAAPDRRSHRQRRGLSREDFGHIKIPSDFARRSPANLTGIADRAEGYAYQRQTHRDPCRLGG